MAPHLFIFDALGATTNKKVRLMKFSAAKKETLKALHPAQQLPACEETNSPLPGPESKHKRAEYRIIDSQNGIADLELRVNDMLDRGWKLIGGISFDRGCAYQAMARITSEPMEPTVPPPTLSK